MFSAEVGMKVRFLLPLTLVPSGSHEPGGLTLPAGTEALVLNTGPVGTYLRTVRGEGWFYPNEHAAGEYFQEVAINREPPYDRSHLIRSL